MHRALFATASVAALLSAAPPSHAAGTLEAVRAAGAVRCGSNAANDDYTRLDRHGDLTDLADEICKAVAVAVLGGHAKTELHAWPDEQHMLASLRDGGADLAIGTTPTVATAAAFNVGFGPPVFYDGLALLVQTGVASVGDLAGKQVCFLDDALLGEDLLSSMQTRRIAYGPFPFEEMGEMLAAAGTGHCAAIGGNVSQLINMRVGYAPIEKRFRLLPLMLTTDPVAPAFAGGDRAWGMVVTAVVNALIEAEAHGITAANAQGMASSDDPVVARLIGARGHAASRLLGLPDDWALTVITTVGNYGEIFARTLGAESDFKLPRGANQPWSQGGAMLAEPLY